MSSFIRKIFTGALLFVCCCLAIVDMNSACAVENRQLDLADRIFQSSSLSWWRPTIVERIMVFEMSDDLWQKMLEPSGFNAVRSLANSIAAFAKKQGWGDIEAVESAFKDRSSKRPDVEKMVDAWKEKVSITFEAGGTYSPAQFDALKNYIFGLSEFFAKTKWMASKNGAHIILSVDASAKEIEVTRQSDSLHLKLPESPPPNWKKQIASAITAP